MKYVYPAIFTPEGDGYRVSFPDLPGCGTEGASLPDAIKMAEDAAAMWLWLAEDQGDTVPPASANVSPPAGSLANLVPADTEYYRRLYNRKAVKKTLTVPSWLNEKAEKANAPFSLILQNGLKQYLGLSDED